MSQAPYMPVFTDALLGDTLHLSAEEFGAYCLILFVTWSNNGQPLPDDDAELARVCRVSRQKWVFLRKKLTRHFDLSSGFWRQKRLEKEWSYVQHRVDVNRKNGSNGGRAKAAKRYQSLDQKASDGGSTYTYTYKKEGRENHPHPPESPKPRARAAAAGRSPVGERDGDEFERFWKIYPRKVNRGRAHTAFVLARKTATFEHLIAAAERYAAETAGKRLHFVARPENWLGDQRWLDDPENATVGTDSEPLGFAFESPGHWRHRMQLWFDEEHGGPTRANWPKDWGPAPGEPDCEVPPDVLGEFRGEG